MIQSLNNKIRWLNIGKVISNVLLVEYNCCSWNLVRIWNFIFSVAFERWKSHNLFETENLQNSNKNAKFYFFSRARIKLFILVKSRVSKILNSGFLTV